MCQLGQYTIFVSSSNKQDPYSLLLRKITVAQEHFHSTVKPALVTTCIQRPPVFRDHFVVSQLWLYNSFLPLLRDHLYSKTTFFWPKRGRLIQVSLYDELQVVGLLLESPNLFLREVCRKVSTLTGVMVSESTICRILQRHGLTRKKTQQRALQRSYIF